MHRLKFAVCAFVLVATLCVCASVVQAHNIGPWFRNWEGIEYAEGTDTSPLVHAFALRISLKNPDVQTCATPSNGGRPYETDPQTPVTFANVNNLKAAINANFFDPSQPGIVLGSLISMGNTVSGYQWEQQQNCGCYEFLGVTYDKYAWLGYCPYEPTGWYNGVTGNFRVLVNGNAAACDPVTHPRTAAGISADGKYLYLVVVDGRDPNWSAGVTHYDLGVWCSAFGAYNAVNLDGGASSCMALRIPSTGSVMVMNHPSDGSPRTVGANLGIISAPMGTVGPSVCSMNSGRIDMVIRGNQNYVDHLTWTSGGGWVNNGHIYAGVTYDTPAICSCADGKLDAFIRGTNNALWHAHYENNAWSNWESFGGTLLSGPSACALSSNSYEVVYRGSDNQVWWFRMTGGTPSWNIYGGYTYDRPAIVSRIPGQKNVFYRGTNNQLYYNWYDGSTWSNWSSLGGVLTSGPDVCSRNSGNLEIVYRGSSNELRHLTWNQGASPEWTYGYWGPPSLAGIPAICSLKGTNTASVYVRGTDDHRYHCAWNGSWTGLGDQGAYY